jgi:CubicO group peptidase (beta-lactamase class C family)
VNHAPDIAVRGLLDGVVRAGIAPGAVAGWQPWSEAEPTVVASGQAAVRPAVDVMTEEMWFDLASLTKPLVITSLVALLVRNGDLSLETTVAHVIPELDGKELGRRRIRHLLNHTSGLPAWEPFYAIASSSEPPEVIRALGGMGVGEIGEEVVYSCPGFVLLGLILERLTDTRLDELHRRLVIEPLGLTSEIGFRPPPDTPLSAGALAPVAECHLMTERGLDPVAVPAVKCGLPDDGNARFLGGVSGNAGLFGTIRGVLGLARAMAIPGALLTAKEITLTTRDHTPTLGQSRGLGWQLAGSPGSSAGPALSPIAFGHNGFTGTSLWIDPVRRLTMALLTNRNHPVHRGGDLHPLRRRFHQLVVEATG